MISRNRRFSRLHRAWVVCLCLGCAAGVRSADLYVSASNEVGPWSGGSWATAYKTVAEGLTALAASNAVQQGGHTLWLGAGTYSEQLSVDATHSGLVLSPNTIAASNGLQSGMVKIERNTGDYHSWFTSCSNLVVEGLLLNQLSAYGKGLRIQGTSSGIVLRNCIHFRGTESVRVESTCQVALLNSLFFGAHQNQTLLLYGTVAVTNCIFLNSSIGGAYLYGERSSIDHCCFYATAKPILSTVEYGQLNTLEEINSLPSLSGNSMANPGFVGPGADLDFSRMYANSPCLNAGAGGLHIGPFQDPVLVPVSSNTYHVATDGDDSRSPETARNEATPWKTIVHAVEQARAGDTVLVQAGTYAGTVEITRGGSHNLPLLIRGVGEVLIEKGSGQSIAMKCSLVGDVVLDGLAFVNSTYGLVLDYSYASLMTNCVLRSNTYAYYTSGAYGHQVVDTRIHNNSGSLSGYGALSFRFGGNAVLDRCLIYSNAVGVGSNRGSAELYNCNFHDQTAWGLDLFNTRGVTLLENCNLVANVEGGLRAGVAATPVVRNSIIAWNAGPGLDGTSVNIPATFNCFWQNGTDFLENGSIEHNGAEAINGLSHCSDNLAEDPQFRDRVALDFRLLTTSPCLNRGTEAASLLDLYGGPRQVGSAVDIGSHELPPFGTLFLFF